MGDDKTLRRVLAHELAHHEDYMVNYLKQVPVMPEKPSGAEPTYEEQAAYADKLKDWIRKGKSLKFQMNMIGGHGAPWKEIANRFNARLGADFVTERSDEQYVRAPSNKEVFLLIRNWPGKEGEPYFVFQWAVRLGPAARKKLDKYWRLNPSFKLVKTPFAPFSYSKHTLGDDAYSREKPENHELLKQLWDTAPDLKGKTAKLPLVKTAPFVAAMNGVKGKIVGQNLGSLEIAQILSNALSRYQIEFKPGFGESGHPEQAKHYLTRAAIDENGGIEIEYENEFYTQFDDMQDYEWNSFVQTVASLVAHELTHRNQMESIKDKYQGETGANYVYKVDKAIRSLGADPDKTSQYLGNPHEVAAFAREAVEELRNIGYKDERILQILSTADLKDAAGDSHTLWTYWDFFGAGDPVFKRFMQQMYKVIANKEASEKEAKTGPHAKCVVMAGLPAPAAAAVVKAALSIPDEELGVDGREDDPHITVKFGVADDIDLLAATLQGVTPFSVTLGKLHVFVPSEASGRQAPVVAEAHAPQLKMLHDKVDAAMSIRPDDFPYSPHVTLAYVKSEVAAKYEGSDVCEGVTFQVNSLLLSRKGGDRSAVPFGKTADHKFVKEPRSAGDVLVAIDPKKLDEVWKNDPGFYIGPGGEGQIGSRYPRFQQWLKDNPGTPIEAPIVSWNPYNNTPSFTNGRHRFSVLRDLGAKKVYIAVPKEDVAIFKKFAARTEPPFSETPGS